MNIPKVRSIFMGLSVGFCVFLAGCNTSGNTSKEGAQAGILEGSAPSKACLASESDMTPATWPPAGFKEGLADQNSTFPYTLASDVKVYAPLPTSFPDHPTDCDYIHFLRIRHKDGPADPSGAAKILIAQPGVLEGAGAFYNVAANFVTCAYKEYGKFVEFWAVDRRPNCLEDLSGLKLADSTGNLHDMVDYYYRGKTCEGKKFAGYLKPYKDAAWLAEMGMEQTLKDWNEIITRGIPDQSVRKTKVYLGGHSMGGSITGQYACADFDGNPGYDQCAGYFCLDCTVTSDSMNTSFSGFDMTALTGQIPDEAVKLMRKGLFTRFVDIPGVIDPEIMHLLTGVGYAAKVKPAAETDLIFYLPASKSVDLCYRFYFSKNLMDFMALTPTIKDFRLTNQALLGIFMDDNSMPISIIRTSAGFFKGGAVRDKNFPFPAFLNDSLDYIEQVIPQINLLTTFIGGKDSLAIPSNRGTTFIKGPLYDWCNYNQLDSITIPKNFDGVPYTTPAKEVTDMNDLARSVGAYPLNFVEAYFPLRLAIDSMMGTGKPLAYQDGVSKHPVINIYASDGPTPSQAVVKGSPIIPGYNHLDVLTAAPVQNNGQPEQVTANLLHFVFSD
jgi:hypothetical protein